jgi:phospholipase/lecithinase/hemolysin
MAGMEVTAVDVFSFISGVAMQPQMFGLTNVTESCVMPKQSPSLCAQPNHYLFWDGIHPTRYVHRMLASLVLGLLDQ